MTSACGATTTPTVDATQIQASAIAVANTMYAQTQAAIPPTLVPTDTPLPSPTPTPSQTPLPLPSPETDIPLADPIPSANLGTDPCNGPLTTNPKASPDAGKIGTNIKIVNSAKAPITVSLYLNINKQGECGYRSYVMSPTSSVAVVNALPFGCYDISAFINDPKKPSRPPGRYVCITGVDKTTITVSADSIKVTGP
jgi:hypothetical protein